eukprot:COSAG01_NODE_47059_length_394_cov_0.701695_1_plen_112_part_10
MVLSPVIRPATDRLRWNPSGALTAHGFLAHAAAAHGEVAVVRELLAASADVNLVNIFGQNALFNVSSPVVVGVLLAAGADPSLCDGDGNTALGLLLPVAADCPAGPADGDGI